MNTWVTDLVPIAGGAFRQLIDDLYRNNRLMQGELMIRGERVDLGRIKANLLNVIATGDHITPPCQSESIMSKVGSTDKELLQIRGGHIGIMAGNQAQADLAADRRLARAAFAVMLPLAAPCLGRYCMCWPPLIEMLAPVMKAASSEHR